MKTSAHRKNTLPSDPKPARLSLTGRQLELFEFLKQHHREDRIPPSTREIQEHFGFASQTAVIHHLRALESKGCIERLPGKARAVRILNIAAGENSDPAARPSPESVPLLGAIPAGLAQLREATVQKDAPCVVVDFDLLGIPRGAHTFALRVSGDSMIGAHILDGDVVIMEFREPVPGDIVAALIDGETTLKRFVTKGGHPYLKAENPAYPDLIPAQELVIQGVMIALLRGRGTPRR